jgi:hypothetical protein
MSRQVLAAARATQSELLMITPYLVPTPEEEPARSSRRKFKLTVMSWLPVDREL